MIKYKLGFKPSPPDSRDLIFSVAKPKKLPPVVDLSNKFPPCYDQGQLSSCTANAIAAALQYDEIRERKITISQSPIPSRLFIYYNERLLEGTQNEDSGAMIRDGVKVCNTTGFPPESIWPYEESKVNAAPIPLAYNVAVQHKVKVYKKINQSLLDLRTVLASGFPIIFGFQVYSNINETETTGILTMPSSNDTLEGGHAVLAIGYSDETKRFKVRNSWGDEWANNGYFEMPYEYLLSPELCQDFWTINLI